MSDDVYVSKRDERYHQLQLVAHWSVVALVAMQFLFNERISNAWAIGVETGTMPPEGGTWTHAISGLLILVLMLWRLNLRRRYGAPPPPETEPEIVQKISRGVHYAFYVLLIGMPIFGVLALWTLNGFFGLAHYWASWVLLILIVAHFAGAMWHAFKKDGVVKRMLRRNPADRASI